VTSESSEVPAVEDATPRAVGWNSLFGVLAFGLPTAVIVVAYPILIDGIGPEQFGMFVLATSLMGAAGTLDLGIAPATTRFVASDLGKGDRGAAARIITTSLVFYAALALVVGVVIWLAAPWLADVFSRTVIPDSDGVWLFRLSAIQVGALFLINVCAATFKGLQRFEWPALLLSALSVASYGGAVTAMVLLGPNVVAIMVAYVIGYLVIGFVAVFLLRVVLRRAHVQLGGNGPSPTAFRRMLPFGLLMTGNSVAGLLLYQIQRFTVGAFIGPGAVTIYQLATVIPGKVQTLVASGTEALFPYTSSGPGRRTLRKTYLRMLVGGTVVALVLLSALVIYKEAIYDIWVGDDLAKEAAALVPAFAAAYFFISTTAAPYHLANGLGRPQVITGLYLLDGTLNVLFLAILLQVSLSLEAVAMAFLVANLLTAGVYQIYAEAVLWRSLR
jgi:O-antigen/teichoic acid export membrane protein